MSTKKLKDLTKDELLAEIEQLRKDLKSERLNEMLNTTFESPKLSIARL